MENEPHNLFEVSNWNTEIETFNELYGDQQDNWLGYVQYEYSQFTNPLQYVEATLIEDGGELTIELI